MNEEIQRIKDECVICLQTKKNGFYLYGSYICLDCEREMVNTDTTEEKYQFYIERLKNIITKKYSHKIS